MQINPAIQSLLAEIDAFMAETRMPQSDFGTLSIGDPNLYRQLKDGREPRFNTIERIRAFMEKKRRLAA